MYKSIIVTLFEGHYEYGVGGLLNSLAAAKFEGLFYVGYKKELPFWLKQLEKKSDNTYRVTETIDICFEKLELDMHFGYYKPKFLLDKMNDFHCDYGFYLDPDIVVSAPWFFFIEWAECGIALCLDTSFAYLHNGHPWRHAWRKLANVDSSLLNNIDYYVNSGFIGLHKRNSTVLERWISLTTKHQNNGGNVKSFEQEIYKAFRGDQEILNAVLTTSSDLNFSIIGKEGMGFSYPAYIMSHAIGEKPWKLNFLKNTLKGSRPSLAERDFFKHITSPIKLYSKPNLIAKKLNLKFASILGRLIG